MPGIKPFAGYLVSAEKASAVVSPAYDSVSAEQRRQFAEQNPGNFLNTMRLLEDYPEGTRPPQHELLETNRSNLHRLLSDGSFDLLPRPSLFLYQLDTGEHVQTGVVCEIGISEYEQDRVRRHESTRRDKEDLLVDYLDVVGAVSSPICLTYAGDNRIDRLVDRLCREPADLEFSSEDGIRHRIWSVPEAAGSGQLTAFFREISTVYLTDGHHRAASSHRYAERMRERQACTEDASCSQLLVVLFPDDQLRLLPFHRCIRDMNGRTVPQLIAELERNFVVEELSGCPSFQPARHGEFGMFLRDTWYRLSVKPGHLDTGDPVRSLDVVILQDLVLDSILGIKDMRSDSRLDYIAGVGGMESIRNKVSEGWEIVFTCHATSIDQLMAVADAGALMPPKSTYFDPKPRSGIFVRIRS